MGESWIEQIWKHFFKVVRRRRKTRRASGKDQSTSRPRATFEFGETWEKAVRSCLD
jgi:hypothetical protein